MKKTASWFFISLGTAILAISTSTSLMKIIADKRSQLTGPLGVHHAMNAGDLVTMSYLDDQRQFFEPWSYHFHRPLDTGKKNTDLYIWGDSYTLEVPDSAFTGVNRYHFGRRDFSDLNYALDPDKKNILIIEDGERFVRGYFRSLKIYNNVKKKPGAPAISAAAYERTGAAHGRIAPAPTVNRYTPFRYVDKNIAPENFINPNLNSKLEYNLFSYNFMNPIRMLKANFVYSCFGRASGNVAISEDGERLFLKETVLPHGELSCYEPIGDPEIAWLMTNIDSIYTHYKREGFDEVYLSIIPNPASILQPAYYNGLIPRIQERAAAKGIPVIDVYTPFAASTNPATLYRTGDTHWNNNGLQIWIHEVNEELKKQQ